MEDELDQVPFGPPTVRVGQSREQAQLRFFRAFKHLKEQFLHCIILRKSIRQKLDKRLNETRTGIDSKTRCNLLDNRYNFMMVQRLQHLDLNNLLDDFKILAKYLLIILDLLPGLNAIGAFVLETAVDVVVLIYQKMYDVFDPEDVEAVLDLLCVDAFY